MTVHAPHRFDAASLLFHIFPEGFDGPRVLAEISEEALQVVFGAHGDPGSLIEALALNLRVIETEALGRHRATPSVPVRLVSSDF
jgi:hypothetical protein